MTLKFLDIYNEVAGQAWSMFDPDAESKEDFESALKSSINKALSDIWNGYTHTFRIKTRNTTTRPNRNNYAIPNGNITKKVVKGEEVYGIKVDGSYLPYDATAEVEEDKTGKPEKFYINGENIYLYPTPDNQYPLSIEYATLESCLSKDGEPRYELNEDDDYINIPEKYETIFKNALITLSMVYAIADETDENYPGYMYQYKVAYDILLKYQKGIDRNKRIFW